jgi:hypothetical protein
MAEHEARGGLEESNAVDAIWRLSGLPALGRAISERIIEGEGREMVEQAARAARNIANGLAASRRLAAERVAGAEVRKIEREKLTAEIASVMRDGRGRAFTELDKFTPISRVGSTARAGPSCNGPRRRWSSTWRRTAKARSGPTIPRVFVSSAVGLPGVLGQGDARDTGRLRQKTATALENLFMGAFELPGGAFRLEPPPVPDPPPPVTLGQTIALDIKGNWWTRWWRRRRSYAAFAEEFSGMIDAEIAPMIEALKRIMPTSSATAIKELRHFVAGQRTTLMAMAGQAEERLDELRARMAQDADSKVKALDRGASPSGGAWLQADEKERVHHDT